MLETTQVYKSINFPISASHITRTTNHGAWVSHNNIPVRVFIRYIKDTTKKDVQIKDSEKCNNEDITISPFKTAIRNMTATIQFAKTLKRGKDSFQIKNLDGKV